MTKFRTWLENWGKIVWPIPIMLILATGSVATANYCAQISGPDLVFMGANFVINSRSFLFNWNNLGKRPALGGMATLFALSDSESEGEKLGEASISQSGGTTTITPTFGYGTAQFNDADIQKSPRSSFLVCATYFDDTGKKYGQNFRFRLGSEEKLNQRPVFYDPSASKKSELCGPDFPGRQELLICNLVHHLGL